jgi:hypothetical protein
MMLYIFALITLVTIILISGKIKLSIQFNKQIQELFSESNIADKKFSYKQLAGLPEPVQKYFKHVLKEGQFYINTTRLTHTGQFKTGLEKDWVDIEGEEYFTTEKPGYIWRGRTALFTARDSYIAGKGRLIVTILSLIKVVDGKGPQYDQGELLRWLAESVWFPTNLLPSKNLQWIPVDSLSARLTFDYNGLSVFFIVRFDDTGTIIEMETKRYMDEKSLETWICKMGKYEDRNAIIIPTEAEVFWRLEKGNFSYAKFKINKIDYNISQKY